jgi:antitoxin component YwqK of YwqJK toxin-antitoxin module
MKIKIFLMGACVFVGGIYGYAKEPDKTVQKDGVVYHQYFYKSGKLKTEIPVVNKKYHGACYGWYENGRLFYIISYIEGDIVCIVSFDQGGRIVKIANYKNKALINDIYYYPSGVIKSAYNMQIDGKAKDCNQEFGVNGEEIHQKSSLNK